MWIPESSDKDIREQNMTFWVEVVREELDQGRTEHLPQGVNTGFIKALFLWGEQQHLFITVLYIATVPPYLLSL